MNQDDCNDLVYCNWGIVNGEWIECDCTNVGDGDCNEIDVSSEELCIAEGGQSIFEPVDTCLEICPDISLESNCNNSYYCSWDSQEGCLSAVNGDNTPCLINQCDYFGYECIVDLSGNEKCCTPTLDAEGLLDCVDNGLSCMQGSYCFAYPENSDNPVNLLEKYSACKYALGRIIWLYFS